MSSIDDLVFYESKPRDFPGGDEGDVGMVEYDHTTCFSVMVISQAGGQRWLDIFTFLRLQQPRYS